MRWKREKPLRRRTRTPTSQTVVLAHGPLGGWYALWERAAKRLKRYEEYEENVTKVNLGPMSRFGVRWRRSTFDNLSECLRSEG